MGEIHVLEDDEECTLLSSDNGGGDRVVGGGRGGENKEMKRVVSIEKLKGSVSTVSFILLCVYIGCCVVTYIYLGVCVCLCTFIWGGSKKVWMAVPRLFTLNVFSK